MRTCLFTLIILILTACTPRLIQAPDLTQIASQTPISRSSQPTSIPATSDAPQMPTDKFTPTSEMETRIEIAKNDLAGRLSIPVSQIILIDARSVVWPDSSLGCPQPGMLYTEALTPGYLILVQANGQDYEFHAGKSSDPFLCENPTPPIQSPGDV